MRLRRVNEETMHLMPPTGSHTYYEHKRDYLQVGTYSQQAHISADTYLPCPIRHERTSQSAVYSNTLLTLHCRQSGVPGDWVNCWDWGRKTNSRSKAAGREEIRVDSFADSATDTILIRTETIPTVTFLTGLYTESITWAELLYYVTA